MDEFRSQLRDLIDSFAAEGVVPTFIVVDLEGADQIKSAQGRESLDKFKEATIRAVVSATNGADSFTYGDDRVVAVLGAGWDRLRTFAMIEKLRRTIPLLGQSFDCYLRPEFDVFEYDEQGGIGAVIAQLTAARPREELSA